MLQKPKVPSRFQQSVSKGQAKEGSPRRAPQGSSCTILGLVDGEVKEKGSKLLQVFPGWPDSRGDVSISFI